MATSDWPTDQVDYGSYHWLLQEVGHYLGIGSDYSAWSAADLARVESVVQSGVMQVYFPPPLEQVSRDDMMSQDEKAKDSFRRKPHTWSFLNQMGTMETTTGVYTYDLPEDFGGSHGDLVIMTGLGRLPIVSEEHLRTLMSQA